MLKYNSTDAIVPIVGITNFIRFSKQRMFEKKKVTKSIYFKNAREQEQDI